MCIYIYIYVPLNPRCTRAFFGLKRSRLVGYIIYIHIYIYIWSTYRTAYWAGIMICPAIGYSQACWVFCSLLDYTAGSKG